MDCSRSGFLILHLNIDGVVFGYEIIPLLCGLVQINGSPVPLKKQDSSFHDASCKEAGLQVLGGINPVADWAESPIE